MSLKHALLGFLSYRDMTGYQLKKYFDQSVGSFWNASLSQIYPTLNKMCEDKLVTVKEVESTTAMNKKVYYITDKGREELVKWLIEPMEVEPMRSEFLVKLYFGANISMEEVIVQLERLIELSKQRLEESNKGLKHIEEEHNLKGDMKREALFWKLTANYGVKYRKSFIEWCEESIEEIKKHMVDEEHDS